MKTPKKLFNVRLSETLIEDLRTVSEEAEIPQSQIVREALKEKVAAMRESMNGDETEPTEEATGVN